MKIAFYHEPNSIHLRTWVKYLALGGVKVIVINLIENKKKVDYKMKYKEYQHENVEIHSSELTLSRNIISRILRKLDLKFTKKKFNYHFLKGKAINQAIQKIEPDILHIHSISDNSIVYIDFNPRIVTLYGSDVNFRSFSKNQISSFQEFLQTSNLIESSSRFIIDRAIDIFNLNLSDQSILISNWGIELKIFDSDKYINEKDNILDRYNIPRDKIVIFSPRSLGEVYHSKEILLSMKFTKEINIHLVMLKGFAREDSYEEISKLLLDNNLSSRVTLIRRTLKNTEMAEFFSISNIYISVPKSDNLASTLFEGILMGCRPILSDLPSYREFFGDTEAKFIQLEKISPKSIAKSIQGLIEDKNFSKPLVNLQDKIKLNFNWVEVIKKKITTYQQILGTIE